ncbi:hypothetical protein Dimus_000162 [Dionaea muscipula]
MVKSPRQSGDLRGRGRTITAGENFDAEVANSSINARRRRLKILRLKSSSSSSARRFQNDAVKSHPEINSHNITSKRQSDNEDSSTPSPSPSSLTEDEVACGYVSHGSSSIIGRRREMEDTVRVEAVVIRSRRYDFFGVYDGHGGATVAEACRDRMHRILVKEMEARDEKGGGGGRGVDWEDVMKRCFQKMDYEVGGGREGEDAVDVKEIMVGSTAVVAVVGSEEVVVANCGDSRAVICRGGDAVPLSVDHKPDRPDELARIEAAGGRVIDWNGPRIGVLAISRSIGDHYLRPYVTSQPEVMVYRRTNDDEFLILATDGLWDVISNQAACQAVRRCLEGRIILGDGSGGTRSHALDAAALLTELAVAQGSMDNVSVVVVQLSKSRKSTCS